MPPSDEPPTPTGAAAGNRSVEHSSKPDVRGRKPARAAVISLTGYGRPAAPPCRGQLAGAKSKRRRKMPKAGVAGQTGQGRVGTARNGDAGKSTNGSAGKAASGSA